MLAVFAVQPMILLYAGSGLSEPMLMLFLIAGGQLPDLPGCRSTGPDRSSAAGLALGFAYLTRYEALAPGSCRSAGTRGAVSWHGCRWRRSGAPGSGRATTSYLSQAPSVFAFVLCGWPWERILVGQCAADVQLERYGNSAQVRSGADSIRSVTGSTVRRDRSSTSPRQVHGLTPSPGRAGPHRTRPGGAPARSHRPRRTDRLRCGVGLQRTRGDAALLLRLAALPDRRHPAGGGPCRHRRGGGGNCYWAVAAPSCLRRHSAALAHCGGRRPVWPSRCRYRHAR